LQLTLTKSGINTIDYGRGLVYLVNPNQQGYQMDLRRIQFILSTIFIIGYLAILAIILIIDNK